jgi:hypothetical protein
MGTKLVELFANRVVERRNMINFYLKERACIESVRGSWFSGSVDFEFFLLLSWFCHFSCLLLVLLLFLLLDNLLELFVSFWSSNCASWGFRFEIQTLCFSCQWTHQEGDWETKWSVPWFDCDESLTCRGLNLNPRHFVSFTFISVSFAESCLLVSWCAGGRCGMAGSDEDRGKSRRPGADDWRWSHRSCTQWLSNREVRWCCVRSASCTR